MTYDSFLRNNGSLILGHALLSKMSGASIPVAYPTGTVTDAQLEELKDALVRYMPVDNLLADLRAWDIRIEDHLSDDWFFAVVFDSVDARECVEPLVDLFLRKSEEYGMDYDQHSDPEGFKEFIEAEALTFALRWRTNVFEQREELLRAVTAKSGTDSE